MKLGQKITIGHKLIRTEFWVDDSNGFTRTRHKVWKPKILSSKIEVLVIGKRQLQNGVIDPDPEIQGFIAKEYISAYLVVEAMHKKPFYIHADDSVLVAL